MSNINHGLQLGFGIQPLNPVPVDTWSGPYFGEIEQDVIDNVNLSIPLEVRFQSMEVRLIISGIARKFWYKEGIQDNNLVEFLSAGSSVVDYCQLPANPNNCSVDNSPTGIFLDQTPASGSPISVDIGGLVTITGYYFSSDGGITHKTILNSGDELYWNPSTGGYSLSTTDSITICYQVLNSGTSGVNGSSGISGTSGTSGIDGAIGATGPSGNTVKTSGLLYGDPTTYSIQTELIYDINIISDGDANSFFKLPNTTTVGKEVIVDVMGSNCRVYGFNGGLAFETAVNGSNSQIVTQFNELIKFTSLGANYWLVEYLMRTPLTSGLNGTSGTKGTSGTSGTSGIDGLSGTSGIDGLSGTSGIDGLSGTSGIDGLVGPTGSSGVNAIIDVTKAQLDTLISTNTLLEGMTYRISGCDIATYGSTGVTLLLLALDTNKLALSGTAEPMTGLLSIPDWREVLYNYSADLISDYGIEKGDYNYFTTIKSEGKLIPEKLYILNEYTHKYYIEETNTSPKKIFKTLTSTVANFAIFDFDNAYDLNAGMIVTIESLPPGYTGSLIVGNTASVTDEQYHYYYRFSNGMNWGYDNIDVEISYPVARFPILSSLTNTTIYDTYGKIQMQPNGLVNTDVHNGTAYGSMTSSNNFVPPLETILLKAKTENSFYEQCISLSFKNDEMIYDFDDSIIYNDNKIQIGTRNGFIKRRFNKVLDIDINKDWRSQRYRRWLLPVGPTSSNYRKKLLNTDLSNTNPYSAFQSKYLFTSELMNTNSTENLYICKSIDTTNITAGASGSVDTYSIQMDTDTGGIGSTSSIVSFYDYPIFELDSELSPINVERCNIYNLENTVFVNNNSSFNTSLYLSTERTISNSTFFGYPQIKDLRFFCDNVIAFDNVNISGFNSTMNNINILSFLQCDLNNSDISNIITGSLPYSVTLSGMGGLNVNTPVRWLTLNLTTSTIKNSLLGVGVSTMNINNSNVNGGCIFHYGYNLNISDTTLTNTNYTSYYSQSYNMKDVLLSTTTLLYDKNIAISQQIPGITLRTDSNSVLYYQNIDIMNPTNTVSKYYDIPTKLFATVIPTTTTTTSTTTIAPAVPIQTTQQDNVPLNTSGNYAPTGITLSYNPFNIGSVNVLVGGLAVSEGYGSRDGFDCYFSSDGGLTAKTIAELAAGDQLYWNGVIAGYDLSPTDLVDLEYDRSSLD